MIRRRDLLRVGETLKPHGIKGELSVDLDEGLAPDDLRCFILDIDGIFVPFFAVSTRPRGGALWLVRFDGVDNETEAAALAHHDIYALRDELPDSCDDDSDEISLYDLEGFTLADSSGATVGVIDSIDDSTANVLLTVEMPGGRCVLIPFAEELVAGLDVDRRVIEMDIPDGLVDLN